MHDIAPMIVAVFMFACTAIIWGGFILARHKERITMIEKGMPTEDIKALYERNRQRMGLRAPMMWGIVLTSIGLAALIGITLNSWYHLDDGVVPALMALFGGIGLIVFYALERKNNPA
jgi:hypothetical protein